MSAQTTRRTHWEEARFSSEWHYDQHRMRCDRLDDAALIRIITKHGERAMTEIAMLSGSGNFNSYVTALERIKPIGSPMPALAIAQFDLFGAGP